MDRETVGTWQTTNETVKVTWDDKLFLTVWKNGRLVGCNLSVEKAQELANREAGERVWG